MEITNSITKDKSIKSNNINLMPTMDPLHVHSQNKIISQVPNLLKILNSINKLNLNPYNINMHHPKVLFLQLILKNHANSK